MENNDDMGRTQNNFRDTRISQSREPYKTTKSFYLPSLNQRTNRNNMALMNNLDIDSTLLKKELSLYKSEMHKKKNELLKLKIKYGKLYEENIANKNLISNILSIPLDKVISREAVLDKIENCKLSELNRMKLQEAYEVIELKDEIADKKMQINEQNNYIDELKKNSKTKIIMELENDYYEKCEKQRDFNRKLGKYKEKLDLTEKEIEKINENIEKLKKNKTELRNKLEEQNKKNENSYQEKNDLIRQNRQLDEKIKRQTKTNREKYNINYENGKRLIDLESNLKEIEDYKNETHEFLKNV